MKIQKYSLLLLAFLCILLHSVASVGEKCKSSSDCLLASQVCFNGRCKNCVNDQECESNSFNLKYCSEGDCIECLSYLDCPSPAKSKCLRGRCHSCSHHSDCFHIGKFCERGTCVNCLSDKDCLDPLLSRCDAGKCVQCEIDSDCRHLSRASADAFECLNSACRFKADFKVRIFQVNGPTSITTTRDRPLKLQINNIHNPYDDISITWLESPSNPKKLRFPLSERMQLKVDPYSLILDPYELDSQSIYKFEVIAQTQMGARQREVFTVEVKRAPLIAWISEGNKRFPVTEDLVLSAAESRDPDIDVEGEEKPAYTYKWSCEVERKTGPCVANNGSKLDLSGENKSILTIQKGTLRTNTPYQFCLKFGSKRDEKTRISEKVCRIVEFCNNCIAASLDVPQSITKGIHQSTFVSVKLLPPYQLKSDIRYEWTVQPRDVSFYPYERNLKIYAKPGFSGNLKIDLKLLSNDKKLDTNLGVSVVVPPPPVLKGFTVEPTSGIGFEQLFKLNIEETNDESLPFEFMFAYSHEIGIPEPERVYTPLTPWQSSSSIQTLLPAGSQLHEGKLLLKATIRDSFGSTANLTTLVSSALRYRTDTHTLIHYAENLISQSIKSKSQFQILTTATMIAQGIQIYDEILATNSKSACPNCSGRGKCNPNQKSCRCLKKSTLPDCSRSLAEIRKYLEFKNAILSKIYSQYQLLTPNEFTIRHCLIASRALLTWKHTINNQLAERSLNITMEIIGDLITFDIEVTPEIRALLAGIASNLASYLVQSGPQAGALASRIQRELPEISKMIHFFSLKNMLPGENSVYSQSQFFNAMSIRLTSGAFSKENHYKFSNPQLPIVSMLSNSLQTQRQAVYDIQYTVWQVNPFNLSSTESNFVLFDMYEYDTLNRASVKVAPKGIQIYYPKFENEKIECRRGCISRGDSKFLGKLALRCECTTLESLSLWQELEKIASSLNIEALLEYQLEDKYLFYVTPVISIIGGCLGVLIMFWVLYDCATAALIEKSLKPEEMSWSSKMIAIIKVI